MAVRIKDENQRRALRFLTQGYKRSLAQVGARTVEELISNWGRGLQGDGTRNKALTPAYRDFKAKKGRKPRRDFLFNGQLWASLIPRRKGTDKIIVTFKGQEEKRKARGNVKHAPRMMAVSDAFERDMQTFFARQMRRTK